LAGGKESTPTPLEVGVELRVSKIQVVCVAPAQERALVLEAHGLQCKGAGAKVQPFDVEALASSSQLERHGAVPLRYSQILYPGTST
jgi:hypothetical protein